MLDIIKTLNEWIQPFKDFVIENHSNPLFWLGAFGIGLAVFAITYSALSKNG